MIVTTYNRPDKLARSLVTIIPAAYEVGAPVLIVNDGGDVSQVNSAVGQAHGSATQTIQEALPRDEEGESTFDGFRVPDMLHIPQNRGLAGALNIGLSYWLADPSIEAIHYFQDDVEVDPLAIAAANFVLGERPGHLVTGHDAREHHQKPHSPVVDAPYGVGLIKARTRPSCRATHVAMTRASWISLMPIPSRGLGLPGTRIMDGKRGTGSGVDWHLCRDSKNAKPVLCVPGVVRSFAHKAADSTWLNEQIAGEDGPLHRDAIREWVEARR